jgi:hypothetical protein
MALHTRRRVLLGAAGLLAGLAGCNDDPGGAGTPAERSPTEPGRTPDLGDSSVRDPERYVLRAPDGPLAWFPERGDGDGGEPDERTGTLPPRDRRTVGVIADDATAGALAFAAVEGVDAAREFVAATDFETETLYLHHAPVEACYRLELCSVSWGGEGLTLRYVQSLRPADAACEVGERDSRATLVRLPVALDPGSERVRADVEWSRRSEGCGGSSERPTPGERSAAGTPEPTTGEGGDG